MVASRTKLITPYMVLVAVYLFVAAAAAVKIGIHEGECSRLIDQIAGRQDLNNVTNMDVNLHAKDMGFIFRFVLKLVYPQTSTVAQAQQNQKDIETEIGELKHEFLDSADACLALVAITVLFLFAGRIGAENAPEANCRKIYGLLAASLIFFAVGILCPVLTAVVRGQHMLVGGFIIETTSKGIVSTVASLLKSGDWIIAVLLTTFSILIPLFKGVATVIACTAQSDARRRRTGRFLEAIGKWSLTDVLVAAVLLGCFSLNAIHQENGGIGAVPRFAFAFFVLYCVMAARTAYLLRRAVKTPSESLPGGGVVLGSAALLVACGAAGSAFGYVTFGKLSWGRELGNIAVVKLVRTHMELMNSKVNVEAGTPARVAFNLPYEGTVSIELKGKDKASLQARVVPVSGGPLGGKPEEDRPLKLTDTLDVKSKTYRYAGRAEAGDYSLEVTDLGIGSDSVNVHITLDP